MTGRLPQRLLLWFIGLLVIALLTLIVVCAAMQIQVPWQVVNLQSFTAKHYRLYSFKKDNSSFEYQWSSENKLDTAEELEQNSVQQSDLKDSSESENSAKSDQANLNTSSLKPMPKNEAKPTEPDFFGDRYAMDDFPSQTNCPNNIRKRVSQTQFSEIFLHSIPVLQWAKHLTPEQYQRLSQYSGAHGWGGIDIEVLKSSLGILNTTANRLMFDDWEKRENRSQCIRCAVVGNGGILNGSRKGKEIDEHDYVFRVNGAVVDGFQNDVGSRTSFYTFSTNTMRNSMRSYAYVGYRGPPISKETRYIFLPDHDRDYILMKAASTHTVIDKGPERSKKPPTYFGEDVTVEKFKIYHPDFIRYLRNRFLHSNLLKTGARKIYRPSTGAVMLLAAIHTCDQVDAYGFMTPDYNLYSDHYYDKQRHAVHFYANHDMRMEMKLWQELHQAGLMNLFMRQ
ncbi:alpha-N-acetylgalactosaminide alpha-2,6-sialyltransferase 2 isoform X1 [Ctenopharyngodon idella]|uniref:alpha-N-acetylgalactosaminide alpha-2,6-sialyltransferase 2 isoform X1 n=1 Tax=Ctenopharyngodon idella TaxID=7959 RepID=UPI002231B3F4|nr:alpha-N-acetylgalactosaminide alpha-2,6-sialyltransferase 2 isoform X1 [Ctenopharyngodon idella]XP_051771616.1 alpha-N-acetylgalactosaminide alpha-2,6-sialyltransferase 2 isoform X1 [Ctenopharyngodon idella]